MKIVCSLWLHLLACLVCVLSSPTAAELGASLFGGCKVENFTSAESIDCSNTTLKKPTIVSAGHVCLARCANNDLKKAWRECEDGVFTGPYLDCKKGYTALINTGAKRILRKRGIRVRVRVRVRVRRVFRSAVRFIGGAVNTYLETSITSIAFNVIGGFVCKAGLCKVTCVAANIGSSLYLLPSSAKKFCPTNPCAGNSIPTFSSCPTAITKFADRNSFSTKVEWTAPVARDTESGGITPVLTIGRRSGSTFERGYYSQIYSATDGCGAVNFCGFGVEIKVTTCFNDLRDVMNGYYRCSDPEVIFGTTCYITCFAGFTFQGQKTIECMNTGVFNTRFGTCGAISCPSLNTSVIANGRYDMTQCDTTYGSICTPVCDPGYGLRSGIVQCKSDGGTGQWYPPVAHDGNCVDIEDPVITNCPSTTPSTPLVFVSPPNMGVVAIAWDQIKATDNSGSATVTQTHGPPNESAVNAGVYVIQITATDADQNRAMPCLIYIESRVPTCDSSIYLPYGSHDCGTSEIVHGRTCNFTCGPGYNLLGSQSITCQSDGQFDAAAPTCAKITCPVPRNPAYGTYSTTRCTEEFRFGSLCSPECSSGFMATSSSSIRCQEDGTWTTTINACRDVEQPVLSNCPVTKTVYAEPGETTAIITWNDVTATDNSGTPTITQVSGPTNGSRVPEGSYRVEITALDSTGNTAHSCFFGRRVEVVNCKLIDFIGDRYLDLNCSNDDLIRGTTCALSCWGGATLVGDARITCQMNTVTLQGEWTHAGATSPYCEPPVDKCPELNTPMNGAKSCDTWNQGTSNICVLQCNSGYDIPVVDGMNGGQFICTSSLLWNPLQFMPNCSETRRGNRMRLAGQFYYYTGNCDDPIVQETIRQNFVSALSSSIYRDACDSRCTAGAVSVSCGTISGKRRKRNADGQFPLHVINKRQSNGIVVSFELETDLGPSDSYASMDIVLADTIEAIRGEMTSGQYTVTINGQVISPDANSLGYGYSDTVCDNGSVATRQESIQCVKCAPGTRHSVISNTCQRCEHGSYQDEEGQFGCKSCPTNTMTEYIGAHTIHECKELCSAGKYSSNGIVPCDRCPLGTYTDTTGSTVCIPCPTGTTTLKKGAASSVQCQEFDLVIPPEKSLTSSQSTENMTEFTLSAWVFLHEAVTSNTLFQSSDGSIQLSHGTHLSVVANGASAPSSIQFPPNDWIHVALVHSASDQTMVLYQDGEEACRLNMSSSVGIATGTSLIASSAGSSVSLKSLFLVKRAFTPEDVTVASNTCLHVPADQIMSMESFIGQSDVNVTLTVPSVCDNLNECRYSPCGTHACINKIGSYTCQCVSGYSGVNCEVPPDFCDGHMCAEGSTCVNGLLNYTCSCVQNTGGLLCDIHVVGAGYSPWLQFGPCSATCDAGEMRRIRRCDNPPPSLNEPGCDGPAVETKTCMLERCTPLCSSSPCGANNTCIEDLDAYTCQCKGGYSGTNCEIPPDACADHTCLNDGKCRPYQNSYICDCPHTFSGQYCQIETAYCGWSSYTEPSPWSDTCGIVTRYKERFCNSPSGCVDNGGCAGDAMLVESKTLEACPACPYIVNPINGTKNCTHEDLFSRCTIGCIEGHFFPPGQDYSKTFICGEITGFVWTDDQQPTDKIQHRSKRAIRLPACGVPGRATGFSTTISSKYPKMPYEDEESCSRAKNGINTKLRSVPCVVSGRCDVKVTCPGLGQDNGNDRSKRSVASDGFSVNVELQSTMVVNNTEWSSDPDILDSEVNETLDTMNEIGESTEEIQNNTSHYLGFSSDGVVYEAVVLEASGYVGCAPGCVSAGGLCVICPVGTKQDGNQCTSCDYGTYQDEAGTAQCKECPSELTTISNGAVSSTECSVVVVVVSEADSSNLIDEEVEEVSLLVIVLPAVLLGTCLVIGIAAAIIYKKCARGNKSSDRLLHTYRRHSMMSAGSNKVGIMDPRLSAAGIALSECGSQPPVDTSMLKHRPTGSPEPLIQNYFQSDC